MIRELDFLPAEYRRVLVSRRVVRSRLLLALLVLLGAVLTESAFRWRLLHLERVAELAEEHAGAIAARASCAADFEDQHALFSSELEQWTKPLELPSAAAMLAALLAVTTPAIELDRLAWSHGLLDAEPAAQRLEMSGGAAHAHGLADWLRALGEDPALPAVELSSSQRGALTREGELLFRVQSKEPPR